MTTYDYDLFTIGAGSGGVRASRFAAGFGARVGVAEDKYLGGTCVNVGCIPKKLLSYAAHYHDDYEDAAGFGWTVGATKFDWATLIANKDAEIGRLNGIYERLLTNSGVTIHNGRAVLKDAHTIEVAGKTVTAKYILVATGGWPVVTNIPGGEHAITSNEAFHLKALPRRVLVVGGGYIAVEFASIFNGLGATTMLAYRGEFLLKEFDADLGTTLASEMIKKGVDVRFKAHVTSIEKAADGELTVHFEGGGAEKFDAVMYAIGRIPNTRGIGLEEAGVKLRHDGAVVVDDEFRTCVDNIYAIGDAIDRMQLTPVALAEGMVVADRLFNTARRTMSYDNVPTAIFAHPNVGTVGLSEAKARQKHANIKIFRSTFRSLKHTISGSDEKMMMKLVVDGESDRVLGVHMVGPDAGEIIQGFAVALNCGATKAQFDSTIGIHPTAAEEFVTMREPVKD
jgi:glutathione reductase (NADPH)